jgi:signal transduction histidine kinase
MRIPRPSRLRPPRRTARLRLATLYGSLFLVCGAALLAITYLLVTRATGAKVTVSTAGGVDVRDVPLSARQMLQIPAGAARQAAVRQKAWDQEQLLIQSGIGLAITAGAAAVLGWFIAYRVLRPLSTITAAARRISASSLNERLALRGPDDELKELGDTLDNLFARLEASFDAQQCFVANASHELRTPVTRERALLQVTLADPAATVATWQAVSRELLASNAEQECLIEALLTLASSEGGLDQREPVDLVAITRAVLAAARPETGRMRLAVQTVTMPADLNGDPLLVQRLVANLIDNAVRHNFPGGHVEVTTGTRRGQAVLSMTNSGGIIPPGEVSQLFQPFRRLGPRRARRTDAATTGGNGLGLSIVRAIATAHGATIAVRALPDGGLSVEVTFPPPAQSGDRADRLRPPGRDRRIVDKTIMPNERGNLFHGYLRVGGTTRGHMPALHLRLQRVDVDVVDRSTAGGTVHRGYPRHVTVQDEDHVGLGEHRVLRHAVVLITAVQEAHAHHRAPAHRDLSRRIAPQRIPVSRTKSTVRVCPAEMLIVSPGFLDMYRSALAWMT